MRSRITVLILLISCTQLFAHTSKHIQHVAADPSYSAALAAANRFLHAWQTQDHETGIMMLTDAARQHVSPEQLQQFFSPAAQAAFEIDHGRKINANEFAFRVVLFGAAGEQDRAHACRIVVSKAGKEDWAVEKLP